MIKIVLLLLSAAVSFGLVMWMGWAALLICPALALVSLLFSSAPENPADKDDIAIDGFHATRPSRL